MLQKKRFMSNSIFRGDVMNKKKHITNLFVAALLVASTLPPSYGFHVGLDSFEENFRDIEQNIKEEVSRINKDIEENWKNFWGTHDDKPKAVVAQKFPSSIEQGWKSSQESIHTISKSLDSIRRKMNTSLPQRGTAESQSSYFTRFKEAGTNAVKELEKAEQSIKELRTGIQKQMKRAHKAQAYDIKEISENDIYKIVISLPGFTQEQVKVTLEDNDKRKHKKLIIEASKASSSSKSSNGANPRTWHSESFSSMRYVNGRSLHLDYKDGKLNVSVDLPENALDQDYTMDLVADKLTINFPTKKQARATRTLNFKKKEQKKNKKLPEKAEGPAFSPIDFK